MGAGRIGGDAVPGVLDDALDASARGAPGSRCAAPHAPAPPGMARPPGTRKTAGDRVPALRVRWPRRIRDERSRLHGEVRAGSPTSSGARCLDSFPTVPCGPVSHGTCARQPKLLVANAEVLTGSRADTAGRTPAGSAQRSALAAEPAPSARLRHGRRDRLTPGCPRSVRSCPPHESPGRRPGSRSWQSMPNRR